MRSKWRQVSRGGRIWLCLRLGLCVLFFAGAWMSESDYEAMAGQTHWLWALVFFSLVGFILFVCVVERATEKLAGQTPRWHPPTLTGNPFGRHKPLEFWHLAAMIFFAAGLGKLGRTIFVDPAALGYALGLLAGSAGCHAGVWLARRIFRRKFAET